MLVFKAFWKIALKKAHSIAMYVIIYAVICMILSMTSQKNIDSNFQATSLDISVIDEDQSTSSKALTDYLGSLHTLVPMEHDEEVIQDHLYYRYISYVLIIPDGFEEMLLTGEDDELLTNLKIPGSSNGYFVDQQVNQYTKSLQLYLTGGYTLEEAIEKTKTTVFAGNTVRTVTFQEDGGNTSKDVFYFFQYLPYIFIALLLCGLAPILLTFQKQDVKKRIDCSGLTLSSKNFQLTLGCICYVLAIFLIFMLMAVGFYREAVFQKLSLLGMLNSFVFLIVAAGLTLFISSFSLNFDVLNMIANIVGLGMAFLCGIFVPVTMLPERILSVGRFLPAYWYVRSNNMLGELTNEPFSMDTYWIGIGIQLLFAAVFFTAAMLASKIQKQKRSA